MRLLAIFLALAFVTTTSSPLFGQSEQDQLIQSRLDEVQKMINEERATITVLEGQLKDANERNKTDQAKRLRTELETAFDRIEELKDLKRKLTDLRDANAANQEEDRSREKRPVRRNNGRRRAPNPTIAGLEGSKVDFDQGDERGDRLRGGRRGAPQMGRGNDRDDRDNREPSRLRNLRDALESLTDAGEFGLARSIEQLIRQEEKRLKEDGEDTPPESRPRNSRPRADERDRDRGSRDDGARDGGGRDNFGGLISADGDGVGRRRNNDPRDNRNRDRADDRDKDMDDVLDQLRDEIERLRGEVRDLKDSDR